MRIRTEALLAAAFSFFGVACSPGAQKPPAGPPPEYEDPSAPSSPSATPAPPAATLPPPDAGVSR